MKRSNVFFLPIFSLFISTTFSQTIPKLTSETFSGLKLRGIGPALMGERIADISIHPQRQSTWYVAVGPGVVEAATAGTNKYSSSIFEQEFSQ